MLHGLTRLEGMTREAARTTVLLVAIFPTAFFLLAPYSESMFLLLAVSAFWFARRDRWGSRPSRARSPPARVASASCSSSRSPSRRCTAGARTAGRSRLVSPRRSRSASARALYLVWWRVRFDDALAPWAAQRNWQRELTVPWRTLIDATGDAWSLGGYWLVDALVVGVVLVAVIAGLRWLRPGYSVYALASLAVPLFYPWPVRPLLSMPRFVLVVFPAFWVIARAVARGRLPASAVIAVSAGAYALLAALFVNWWDVF